MTQTVRNVERRTRRGLRVDRRSTLAAAVFTAAALSGGLHAAPQEVPAAPPPVRNARAAAPVDLTGYWVSVVTEDWAERMITPPRGEYAGIPLNAAGRQAADGWDPAKDQATGNQCRAYGAPGVMRQPGRLHVTWPDDNTLKIETDAGAQTRLLRFGGSPPAKGESQWQGYSAARWMQGGTAGGAAVEDEAPAAGGRGRGGRARPQPGSLKVVTTQMRPGYLRLNGVPYSASATLTEYVDRVPGPGSGPAPRGDSWLIVFSVVEDPQYLTQPFITSAHFKLEPDGSKWKPRPCETTLPIRGK